MPATHPALVARAARTWFASTLLRAAALQKASACRRGAAQVLAGSLPIAVATGVACLGLAIFPAMLPDQCRAFSPSMVVGVGVLPVCLAALAGPAFAQTQVPSAPTSRARSSSTSVASRVLPRRVAGSRSRRLGDRNGCAPLGRHEAAPTEGGERMNGFRRAVRARVGRRRGRAGSAGGRGELASALDNVESGACFVVKEGDRCATRAMRRRGRGWRRAGRCRGRRARGRRRALDRRVSFSVLARGMLSPVA
jgi:hypothetical protein